MTVGTCSRVTPHGANVYTVYTVRSRDHRRWSPDGMAAIGQLIRGFSSFYAGEFPGSMPGAATCRTLVRQPKPMTGKPNYRRMRPPIGVKAQHPIWAKRVACPACGARPESDCTNEDKTSPSWCHGERCSAARAAGHETRKRVANYGDPV